MKTIAIYDLFVSLPILNNPLSLFNRNYTSIRSYHEFKRKRLVANSFQIRNISSLYVFSSLSFPSKTDIPRRRSIDRSIDRLLLHANRVNLVAEGRKEGLTWGILSSVETKHIDNYLIFAWLPNNYTCLSAAFNTSKYYSIPGPLIRACFMK